MIAAEIKLLQEALQQTRFISIRQSLLKRIYHLGQQSERDAAHQRLPGKYDDSNRQGR